VRILVAADAYNGPIFGPALQNHLFLKTVEPADFDTWPRLFEASAVEIGGESLAAAFLTKATRVAASSL